MRRLLAPLILVPALAACSMNTPRDSSTGSGTPDGGQAPTQAPAPGGPITVELKQREPGGAPDGATGGTGTVAVRGTISTPNPCYALAGAAASEGRTLTLTVTARSNAEVCVQSIGTLGYDATLRGVPAGSYTVRVVHTYAGTGWPTETALTQEVQVR
jgi:hypothetical protein